MKIERGFIVGIIAVFAVVVLLNACGGGGGGGASVVPEAVGILDDSFIRGKIFSTYDSGGSDYCGESVVQADGKIVVVGNSYNINNDLFLSRYNVDGTLDTTFGVNGYVVWDNGIHEWGSGVALQSDGKIIVSGWTNDGTLTSPMVLRFDVDGVLDPTFGVGGIFSLPSSGQAYDVATLANDKILVSGDGEGLLWRLNSNGTLDTTFGTAGFADWPDVHYKVAYKLSVQADGKIVVVGYDLNSGNNDLMVVRFNSTGTLDTTFANGGGFIWDGGGTEQGENIALQSDGKILVTGFTSNGYDVVVLRLNTDGTLDNGFGLGGIALWDNGGFEGGYALSVRDNGSILVAGSGSNSLLLLQFTDTGVLDTRFGVNGVFTGDGSAGPGRSITLLADGIALIGSTISNGTDTDALLLRVEIGALLHDGGYADAGYAVAVQSDGKVVVAGTQDGVDFKDIILMRFNSDGSPDTTFGNDGVVLRKSGLDDVASALAIQDDGKIIVVGRSPVFFLDVLVLRFNSDGSPDTSFGVGGAATFDISISDEYPLDVKLQSDGKILISGFAYVDAFLMRLNTDGTIDEGFGEDYDADPQNLPDGYVLWDSGGHDRGYSIGILSSGKILVGGGFYNNANATYDAFILRFTSNGVLDASFGSGGFVTWDSGYQDSVSAMTVSDSGKIDLAVTSNDDIVVVQYNLDGTLDTDFGVNGVAAWNGGHIDYSSDLVFQPNGKILVTGIFYATNYNLVLLRFNADGTLDGEFGTAGVATWDSGFGSDQSYALATSSSGQVYVVGSAANGSTDDLSLLRFR